MNKSCSVEETVQLAKGLACQLPQGGLVLLYGDLGVGKTVFVKGLVEGFKGSRESVNSPTFTIMQHYEGRLPITHVDLYRLSMREVEDLGLEEVIEESGVTVIEWADRIGEPYPEAVKVTISDAGADQRTIDIRFP
tara:strand:- start:160 stop:567 length:408 start_codon:yes stop_codon:yes gene_type:complete